MAAGQDRNISTLNKEEVKDLIEHRLVVLRQPGKETAEEQRAFVVCQESILREVLRRADSRLDSTNLLTLVDLCIQESHLYERCTTDKGLKSFYKFRIKVLRRMLLFVRRYIKLKRWQRPRKVRS